MGKQSSGVKDPFIALSGSSQTRLINVLINLLRLLLAVVFFFLESLPKAEYPLGWTGLNLRVNLSDFYLQASTMDLKEICSPGPSIHSPCEQCQACFDWDGGHALCCPLSCCYFPPFQPHIKFIFASGVVFPSLYPILSSHLPVCSGGVSKRCPGKGLR